MSAKNIVDATVTAIVAVAAVVVLWRALPIGERVSARGEQPALQDTSSLGLVTTIDGAPYLGSTVAPMVMIEYSDFECPFCARYASETFGAVEKDFVANGNLQYVFRNFPIEQIHVAAIPAARAARCATRQGRYMELRTHLFANQKDLARMDWMTASTGVGLETAEFQACLNNHAAAEVASEKEEGKRLGVTSTPSFLFGRRSDDGKVRILWRLAGMAPYPVFKTVLDRIVTEIRK